MREERVSGLESDYYLSGLVMGVTAEAGLDLVVKDEDVEEGASGTCLEQSSREGFLLASSQIPCSPSETPCLQNKYLNNTNQRHGQLFCVGV